MKKHPFYHNYLVGKDGQVKNHVTGKSLKQKTTDQGYKSVTVFNPKEKKYVQRRVHRLVAETYIGEPCSYMEVNHIDCDKSNNHLDNLEWVTSKENKDHAWSNGLYNTLGENHGLSVINDDLCHTVCRMMQQGYRNKDICDDLGLAKHIVADIRSGRKWKHISGQYNLSVERKKRKNPDTVVKVAMLLEEGKDKKYIEQQTGVPVHDINRIKRRDIFYDLTNEFNF